VKALRKYASDTIKQNYTISQSAVTQEMLDVAKDLIDRLNSIADKLLTDSSAKSDFNDTLIKLFKTIPRKMNKVNDYLIATADSTEAAEVIDREQKLYDVLLANFQTQQASAAKDSNGSGQTSSGPTETILEKFGLECELVVDQAKIDDIKKHLGQVASKFKRAFVVVNKKTQDAYAAFKAANPNCKTKLFFHGSKNENFWSILKNGLLLNPKATITGKMLGCGIYASDKAVKSLNYTSLRGSYWSGGNSSIGYMAIFAFAIDPKNCYNVTTSSEISTCYGMTWEKLQKIKPGATYVFAHKGPYLKENEICIYREDQCTIRYLIELAI
jgi:poly [ADP-ribose] polymerase